MSAAIAGPLCGCDSPTEPAAAVAGRVTSVRYARVHPVNREAPSPPRLVIQHIIIGDSLRRTYLNTCTLYKVEDAVFECNLAELGRPLPANAVSGAYVFDDAVGTTPLARDIYVNGYKLVHVTGDVGQGEYSSFILQDNGDVRAPEAMTTPKPGPTAVPR